MSNKSKNQNKKQKQDQTQNQNQNHQSQNCPKNQKDDFPEDNEDPDGYYPQNKLSEEYINNAESYAKHGGFSTHPISQPDMRQERSEIALPNDENVTRARNFINQNHK